MTKTIIGTMSGTSMDGIDAALLETDGEMRSRPGATYFRAYSKGEREVIEAAMMACYAARGRAEPEIARAESVVREGHLEAINNLINAAGLSAKDVDLVGFHGQTVFHAPDEGVTIQIGDGEKLAKASGIDVACDFRSKDVAAGGQGAPLVPIFHKAMMLAGSVPLPAAVVNIGGVANVTIITDGGLSAFDTGPGNALIDDWIRGRTSRKFDEWGRIAGEGRINEIFVNQMMSHPFFDRPSPKSLDRNMFEIKALDRASLADGAATLTAFSARTIARALEGHKITTLFVTGGGANNRTMMRMLQDAAGILPQDVEPLGYDGDFVEACAFAYLAARVEKGLAITFPATTGVKEPIPGGTIFKA